MKFRLNQSHTRSIFIIFSLLFQEKMREEAKVNAKKNKQKIEEVCINERQFNRIY